LGGKKLNSDSTVFFLVADLGFTSIDTIENKEIKAIEYFSRTDSEDLYFVYKNQLNEFQIGRFDVETNQVILEIGNYSSVSYIDQIYFFNSGVAYLRSSGKILKSRDFGTTWDSVSASGNVLYMDFFNEDFGLLALPISTDSNYHRVFKTEDGIETNFMVLDSLDKEAWNNESCGTPIYFKLISEHSFIVSGVLCWFTTSGGASAFLGNDFRPFTLIGQISENHLPPYTQLSPVIPTESCVYIPRWSGFYRTCKSDGLVNSNELISNSEIKIYPNPASTQITIKSPPNLSGNLKIYDSLGRFHFQQKLTSNETQIQIDELSNGLYFLVNVKLGVVGTFVVQK